MNNEKRPSQGPIPPVFLILGIAFTAVGASTEYKAFVWLGLAFVLVALGMALRRAREG